MPGGAMTVPRRAAPAAHLGRGTVFDALLQHDEPVVNAPCRIRRLDLDAAGLGGRQPQ